MILTFGPYISHTTSAFKELKMLMLEDLYKIQLYKIYYTNHRSCIILPAYFQTFTPDYNTAADHNHDLRLHYFTHTNDKKRIQCTMHKISIFKINPRNFTIGSRSVFDFNYYSIHSTF